MSSANISKAQERIEQKAQSSAESEDLGSYCNLFSAKTKVEGQDGGVVTALLIKGFSEGLFDAVVVVRRVEGYSAEAVVAHNAEDVLAARGTTYLKINVTAKLRELIAQGKKRIAVVCTPCEAKVARRIQQTIGKDCEITIIGLFCFEAFNNQKLKDQTHVHLGVDLDRVGRTQVRGGKFTVQTEGGEVSCKVKDLGGAAEGACAFCDDFTSRSADVSVGSVGSKPGYSTVIVRSAVGAKLVEGLVCASETADEAEVVRLSRFKRKRAEKSFAEVKKR
ncbi:MAG: Coenzyme F420 hydrogenase/dehydrogenase, beta subunit C-terminal domain [Candidatus Bathyarchaeia archaeon]|jgi:coenzyme F420 hydrogenase subunit beta